MIEIEIDTDFIKLSQFIKYIDLVNSGGEAKIFLLENDVYINSVLVEQKGKKIYKGDIVKILDKEYLIC